MSSTRKLFIFVALPLVVIFAIVAVFASRPKENNDALDKSTAENGDTSIAQLTLHNLGGITLAAYDATTGLAGDIKFSKDGLDAPKRREVPFFMFGQELPKNSADEPQRLNPNFEFRSIATQIDIIAAIDGIVVDIKQQADSSDYELFLIPSEDSPWVVGYDHIVSPTVKRGDTVKVGQKLGLIAPENSGGYRYELQINNTADDMMYCPTTYFADHESLSKQFIQLVDDWEKWYGKDVYPRHDGGCLAPWMTVAESEGR